MIRFGAFRVDCLVGMVYFRLVLLCMTCFNCVDVFIDVVGSLWFCLWFLVLFCLISWLCLLF